MVNRCGRVIQITKAMGLRLESAMLRESRSLMATLTCASLSALVLAGCGAMRDFDDPIAAMTDPRLTAREQAAAMEQARLKFPEEPRRIERLKEIISGPGHSLEFRAAAWRQLEARNPDEARAVLEYRLPTHPAWGFVEWACELIVERGWVDLTPSLVRSLYRPSPSFTDEMRPERLALERLHGGRDIREVVFEVVVQPPRNVVHAQWRLAAWELLNRLGEPDLWQQRLADLDSDDPLLEDLRLGFVELAVIARTREEVLRLQYLRREENRAHWQRCRDLVASLSAEQRQGLRLRHLPVLDRVAAAHPQWLGQSSPALLASLEARFAGKSHFHPDAIMSASTLNTGPQSLREWGPRLTWPDLLTVRLAEEMVFDAAMARQLFPQAQRDREDTSTEYGGLIDLVDGQARATLYPPIHRSHDQKYYAPAAMIEAGCLAPFHYHFHAQEVRNAEFAGPGGGDIEYAHTMAVNALVFTSVGEGRLNADFYTEGRTVIDLGTIEFAK